MAVDLYALPNAYAGERLRRAEGYTGGKIWMVRHPRYKSVSVYAPDKYSAIKTACQGWGVRWQSVDNYAYSEAFLIQKGK